MRRLLLVSLIAGCGTDAVDQPLPPDPVPHQTTWYQDVGPIVATKCMGCHHDGGIAPFSLETYEDAATYGLQMLAAVESGQMPPWSATTATDCAPTRSWKHDPRLTAPELDTLHAWIDDDRPAGDFAQLSPAAEQHLIGTTHSLVPATPFVTTGDADQFMCFVLDPQITDLTFMTGWEVVPGNPSVVHHAVVMTMDPAALQAAKDAGAVGVALPCGAAPAAQIIGAWAPGQGPVEMPDGVASVLTPGTGVVVQIHYHPAGNLNEPDATAVNLRLTTDRPTRLYAFGGWGNAHGAPQLQPDPDDTDGVHFLIPANNANHTETMIFNIPDTATRTKMFIMQPHQHYIGTRLELRIHRADPQNEPADECLVNSDWNFDWQRTYQYDVPIDELPTFGPGDQVTVRCTYNNTLANPFVQRALAELHLEAPIDVHLGEQTTDEMCLGLTGLIVDVPQ